MAQPTAYDRQASFSNIQAQAPSDPLPGATVDSEFNAVKTTLDEVLTNLALIQRDDGALANESVGLDQLSAEIEVGWQAPEVWVTGTAYVSGDTVFNGSGFYRLLTAHTAGTFATDLAATKWELIVDLSGLTIVAASQIANTPAGTIAATTVQAAIDELASEKAASSHTHPSSAITDSTAAGRSMISAATAAAQRTLLSLGALALLDTVAVTDITANVALTGVIEPTALGSNVNDWAPTGIATCSTIRASASVASVNITGILAPAADGALLVLENVGVTYPITLAASSASSAAANRFLIPKAIEIPPNTAKILKYDLDGTTPRWRVLDTVTALPRSYLAGLAVSTNASDATNDIDIAVGEARGTLGILDLSLATALTKRLDADWAAGTNAGMRYSGAAITDTTYHIFLIGKPDGTTDIFAYTGVDPSAVLPSGYVDYRRIFSLLRESSANVAVIVSGDTVMRKVAVLSYNGATIDTTRRDSALGVPLGVRLRAIVSGYAAIGNGQCAYLFPTDITDPTISANAGPASGGGGTSAANVNGAAIPIQHILTDTSGAISRKASGAGTVNLYTVGWIDTRGRDA